MRIWVKLAWREIRNDRKFSAFFVLNLAIGLIGFLALNSFNSSIQEHLGRNAKGILTADLAVNATRPFTEVELQTMEQVLRPEASTRQVSFVSMAANETNSRLAQIIAVDDGFPFYGEMQLQERGIIGADVLARELSRPVIWVYPDLLTSLGLEIGDTLKIGNTVFTVEDAVLRDPGTSFSTFGVASRIYMSYEQASGTGLMELGKSRVFYRMYYKLPPGSNENLAAEELQKAVDALGEESYTLRIQTPARASEQVGRALGYLNNYLGLVSLVALFLAGLGAAYLFRDYLHGRFQEIAILMSLGAPRNSTYLLLLSQIVMLGGIAVLVAGVGSLIALPILPELVGDFLPQGFTQEIPWNSLGVAMVLGTLGSLIFCLPVLTSIHGVKPILLLRDTSHTFQGTANWKLRVLSYAPGLLVYGGLVVWVAGLKRGGLFLVLFLGALGVLSLLAWVLFRWCGSLSNSRGPVLKIALRSLNRNRVAAISCFLSMSLGTLLINLIPQIQQGLQQELQRPEDGQVPTFFVFDIQPEQVDGLRQVVAQAGFELERVSPLIRARVSHVNGEIYEGRDRDDVGRDEQRERRRRSRTYNLSYLSAEQLADEVVMGTPLRERYDFASGAPAKISLEKEFAGWRDWRVGDRVTFDVSGIPVETEVANIREVKWTTFQPDFFITLQPGVLEDAPQVFLASIRNVPNEDRIALQNAIVRAYPNISVVDVTRILERVFAIIDQVSFAINFMAYLAILAGLIVLYSIARQEVQGRMWEMNLLKTLGARFPLVMRIIQAEFGMLALFAAASGLLLSLIFSYVVSYVVFENIWSVNWGSNAFTLIAVVALSVTTATLAGFKTLRQKPLALLRAI
jgi:putative ABC transport system permease protein